MLDYTRDVLPYLTLGADGLPNANLRHAFYQASIDHRDHLRKVFRKTYPDYLDINRPKEQVANKNYRRRVYRNPFRGLRTRIIETLDYIRQADDFSVAFPTDLKTGGENLETYTGGSFSGDGDLTSWFFRRVRPLYVKDPNAVLIVLPTSQPTSDTVRAEPRALLVECQNVIQHKKGRFCVAISPEKSWIKNLTTQQRTQTGVILLFVDADSYCVATQVASEKDSRTGQIVMQWTVTGLSQVTDEAGAVLEGQYTFRPPLHYCPQMPAVKIGKQQQDEAESIAYSVRGGDPSVTTTRSNDQGEEYYESLLSDALPFIERAQQIENDIAVELNFHVSSQEWRYATKKCPNAADNIPENLRCIGGVVIVRDGEGHISGAKPCEKCQGSGMALSGSGTETISVTPPEATGFDNESRPSNLPIPPGGFIPRSIEPLKQFAEQYKHNSDEAYATLNMQFLKVAPTNQSGESKKYDKEELYRELNTQGAHMCFLLRLTYGWTGWQRYRTDEQVPAVIDPVRFNIQNAELTRAELIEAVEKKFDAGIRAPLEKKLIGYQSGEASDYYRRYELKERIDPLPNMNSEEKQFLLATQRLILKPGSSELQLAIEETWLSIYLDGLVTEQLRKGDGFWGLTPDEQYNRLLEATRKRVGTLDVPPVDPITGKPAVGSMTLQPLVDLKNANQLG